MHNNSNRLQIFDKKLLLMIREGTLQTMIHYNTKTMKIYCYKLLMKHYYTTTKY